MSKRALVLSGGGMFGAWQVGAWSILAREFRPDLVVGASVGSLNGYAIASGCTCSELLELWRRPRGRSLGRLAGTIRSLVESRPLRIEYAVVLVNALRLEEEIFSGAEVTWRHLAASCAVPLATWPKRIEGRWYVDGGLLHALPIRAAVSRGATRILCLNVLPEFPMRALKPVVRRFQSLFGPVTIPGGVISAVVTPTQSLGSLSEASFWKLENIERWYGQGREDASAALKQGLVPWELRDSP